jgi:hypothetical protein
MNLRSISLDGIQNIDIIVVVSLHEVDVSLAILMYDILGTLIAGIDLVGIISVSWIYEVQHYFSDLNSQNSVYLDEFQ